MKSKEYLLSILFQEDFKLSCWNVVSNGYYFLNHCRFFENMKFTEIRQDLPEWIQF